MFINFLVMIILSAAAWACFFPEDALAILASLKRQLRLRVMHRHGEGDSRILESRIQDYASRRRIAPELVNEILAENHGWISERLGSKAADEILGETEPGAGWY